TGDLHDAALFIFIRRLYAQKLIKQPKKFVKIEVTSLSDDVARHLSRFTVHDLIRLTISLHLPVQFTTKDEHKFTGHEGLFILCTRLTYPTRVRTLGIILGWSETAISGCITYMLDHIHDHWQYLLFDLESG